MNQNQKADRYFLEISPDVTRDFATRNYQGINILFKANMITSLNMEFKVSLHVLCDLISEMISYDKALLYLWDNDMEQMVPYIARGFPGSLPEPLRHGNLFAEWCVEYGKTLYVPFSEHTEVARCLESLEARTMIGVPIYKNNNIIGTLQLFRKKRKGFTKEQAKLLWLLMIQSEALFRNFEEAEGIGSYSPMGQVLGHSSLSRFYDQLDREIGRAQRRKTPMSLLLVEIDQWNDYNGRFGHLWGEETLGRIHSIFLNQARQIDSLYRYGENRFALILTETDRKGGEIFADRLRSTIDNHRFPGDRENGDVHMTISGGLVTFPFDARVKLALIEAAEQTLQKALDSGGNRIAQYPSESRSIKRSEDPSQHIHLDRVTRTIHSIFNLDRLLEFVVSLAMETLHAGKGSLLLAGKEEDDFIIKVACGFGKNSELIKNSRIPSRGTVTGWVAALKKPVVVHDIDQVKEVHRNLYKDYRNNSFLSIPLVHRGRVQGVVHLANKEDGKTFTDDDLKRILPLGEKMSRFLSEGLRFEKTQQNFSKIALSSLATILEARDPYYQGHSEKVAHYARELALKLHMNAEAVDKLTLSARLHDIGKISIANELFNKPGALNEEEISIVRRHPFFSWKILDALTVEEEEVKNTILQHHEKLNGSGYPYGLVGDQIPLSSRILSVADTFVSMTSNRSYRPAFSQKETLKEMKNLGNIHFDPVIVNTLADMVL